MDPSKQVPGFADRLNGQSVSETTPTGDALNKQASDVPPPPPVDATVHVTTDENELTAYLMLNPPENGGAAPTLNQMLAALSAYGINCNIDTQKLVALENEPVYGVNITAAAGVAPVDGENGTAAFLIRTEKADAKPKIREDGSVDFYDLDIIENVTKDQVLCRITPPTEGTPGITVKGQELKQKKGRPVPSYLGSNTMLTDDGTAIVSTINGQASFVGNQIHVNETYYLNGNVDYSTGNIKFVGSLVVMGAVKPGFAIEAEGNIEVRGIAESCTIKAGGNVLLKGGIIGSKLDCGGSARGRFIENSTLFVKGDVHAECIIDSNIKCGKNIKTMGSSARIIGGSLIAGQNIEAHFIGSPAGVLTKLEIGTDPAVINRQQELIAEIRELEKSITSMQPLITMLRQLEAAGRLTAQKKEILDNVGYSYDVNSGRLEDGKRELEEITQSIKEKGFGRIVCTDTMHWGTVVTIGGETLAIKENLFFTALYYDEDEIRKGLAR